MAGPNSLGRRADWEETQLRIDSQQSVPELTPFLKARRAREGSVKYLVCVIYTYLRRPCWPSGEQRPGVKSDRFFRWNWRFQHAANSLKNSLKSRIVPLFHCVNFSAQFLVRCEHFAKPNEGSYDRDIYLNGARAAEPTGKHRYSLLREGIRSVATASSPGFEVPDWNPKLCSSLGES